MFNISEATFAVMSFILGVPLMQMESYVRKRILQYETAHKKRNVEQEFLPGPSGAELLFPRRV